MKKSVKILTMVLALGVGMSAMTCALGEGEDLGMEVQNPEMPESVEVEMIEEAANTDAIAEAQVEPTVETPIEQTDVQMMSEEKTEVGSEKDVVEPAANELIEIEDQETPLGLFDLNGGFTGTAEIQRRGEGALHYGDQVTLTAQVSNANRSYAIRWEVNCQDDAGWRTIAGVNGLDYSFVLTRDNADYEYRVVLVAAA